MISGFTKQEPSCREVQNVACSSCMCRFHSRNLVCAGVLHLVVVGHRLHGREMENTLILQSQSCVTCTGVASPACLLVQTPLLQMSIKHLSSPAVYCVACGVACWPMGCREAQTDSLHVVCGSGGPLHCTGSLPSSILTHNCHAV